MEIIIVTNNELETAGIKAKSVSEFENIRLDIQNVFNFGTTYKAGVDLTKVNEK